MSLKNFIHEILEKRPVALFFGGRGYEHDVSRLGAANFIEKALSSGRELLPVYIDKRGDFFIFCGDIYEIGNISKEIPDGSLLAVSPLRACGKSGLLFDGNIIEISLAIPLLHGDFGEDGTIQGLFTSLGIEFVGADTVSGAVMLDKAYSKAVAESVGVPVLPYLVFLKDGFCAREAESLVREKIGYPAFVKPSRLGSSVGASLVLSEDQLLDSINCAFSVSDRIMVEVGLTDKRELECAYFKVGEKKIISHPAEISVKSGFYDYKKKYSEGGAELCSYADVDVGIASLISKYTEKLASILGARHIARFDYFLTSSGEIYFNEVNSFPGMTSGSLYCDMLSESGLRMDSFIEILFGIARKND